MFKIFYSLFFLSANAQASQSKENSPLLCEELTDSFCSALWSAENRGNFKFSDGSQILYGSRKKYVIGYSKFIHSQKLAKNRCGLPEDLKNNLEISCGPEDSKEDIPARLELLLSQVDSLEENEKSIESWNRAVDDLLSDFYFAIWDTAYERSLKEDPGLSTKYMSNYSPAENKIFNNHHANIKTEIMDSIYLRDPDWLRLADLFEETRADVLTVIDQISLAPETKQIMKEKIHSVRLSLPYEDPRLIQQGPCNKYTRNAFYDLLFNKFAFCLGYINTAQSEGALYTTIAHEIAHAIDPHTFSFDVFQQGFLAQFVKQLYHSNGSLSCDRWEEQKNRLFVFPSDFYQLPKGLAKIDQCLADRSHLQEINHDSLQHPLQNRANRELNLHTFNYTFSYLTTPRIIKEGELKDNDFYMNPKLLAESQASYFENKPAERFFHPPSVFIQEYRCRLAGEGYTEERAFEEAIEETKRLLAVYHYSRWSALGQNSQELAPFNLSKTSSEDFADWIAGKALELKLNRISHLQNKRDFVLAEAALYCKADGLEDIAKHKVFIESRYSLIPHSPNRERILKSFSPKISEKLECSIGEEIKKHYKNCDFPINEWQ